VAERRKEENTIVISLNLWGVVRNIGGAGRNGPNTFSSVVGLGLFGL